MPFSDEEWERAAGVACPQCHRETLRFRYDGICFPCGQREEERREQKAVRHSRFLKFMKQHNARIDGKRGAKRPPS